MNKESEPASRLYPYQFILGNQLRETRVILSFKQTFNKPNLYHDCNCLNLQFRVLLF